MPVGGFVVTSTPEQKERLHAALEQVPGMTVYGSDTRGHTILVIETETSDEMERLVHIVQGLEGVLSINVAYYNAEDEIKRIERGEYKPAISFGGRWP